ncbi:MAG: TIGR03032 family protein [Cryomorphaceae bacterium]|nr:TIGR03032 family protein [Cryomorphaceae bacterium]
MSTPSLTPFSIRYTPNFPELLHRLNASIAISTYQAGKLIFLSAKDENQLIQLPRTFEKPMGFCYDSVNQKLALACKSEIITFAGSSSLAMHYPKSPGVYDMMFLPRLTYHTNALDIHDLHYGKDGALFAVNTLFSCIVTFDDNHNFTPYWTPPQIDKLASEDRCHLNGMAMENGLPRYASAFNRGNTPQSWRDNITKTGVIYDVKTNEVIVDNLPMPHSPKLINGELYVLLSATGEIAKINREKGDYEVIAKPGGFLRGMCAHGEYLFVAHSKLRKNSSTFAKLPISDEAQQCGIIAIHLPTKSIVGKMFYEMSVDEIYDITLFNGIRRPNILNTITDSYQAALSTPNSTFWSKPKQS